MEFDRRVQAVVVILFNVLDDAVASFVASVMGPIMHQLVLQRFEEGLLRGRRVPHLD